MPARFDIFTKPDCPKCDSAKRLLAQRGFAYREHNSLEKGVSDMAVYLTGSTSVPQIFLGDYYVGHDGDLEALDQSGRLEALAYSLGTGTGLAMARMALSDDTEQSAA